MKLKRQNILAIVLSFTVLMTAMLLSGCGGNSSGGGAESGEVFKDYPTADMSGYQGLRGSKATTQYADLSVKDVKVLMDNGASFALFVSYADCPWCNTIIPYVSSVAEDYGGFVGYLDVRKDPSWQSNMDITNYDVFVELFDKYIRMDENNEKHLYVPVIYFVKDGKPVSAHEGVVDGLESPDDILSKDQEQELEGILTEGFKSIG